MVRSLATLRRRWAGDERGATVLEFGFASVIFFMTIFGTIEFGRAVWQYNMMSDLAQEGARWAVVHGYGNTTSCASATSTQCKASSAQIQSYVQSRSPGITVSVTTTPSPDSTTAVAGTTVSVQVQSSFTPVLNIIPHSTMTLSSTSRMLMLR